LYKCKHKLSFLSVYAKIIQEYYAIKRYVDEVWTKILSKQTLLWEQCIVPPTLEIRVGRWMFLSQTPPIVCMSSLWNLLHMRHIRSRFARYSLFETWPFWNT